MAPPSLRALAFDAYGTLLDVRSVAGACEEAFRHAGLRDRFADLLTVEAVRVYKPSPRVYRLAWEALGLRREEVGFVSSNPFDGMGARSAGLWTCWVNRRGVPMDELGIQPDLTVPTLDSLAGALGAG